MPVKWVGLDDTETTRELVQHIYEDAAAYLASRLRALKLAKATGNKMTSRCILISELAICHRKSCFVSSWFVLRFCFQHEAIFVAHWRFFIAVFRVIILHLRGLDISLHGSRIFVRIFSSMHVCVRSICSFDSCFLHAFLIRCTCEAGVK